MHSQIEHLQLTEKLFRDVITHLRRRIDKLEALRDEDERFDFIEDDGTPDSSCTISALRLEICLYSLCLDRVRQKREEFEGIEDRERRHARDNFFRLMTAVAQSELLRDSNVLSFGLSSRALYDGPLSEAQIFTALEGTAERQLAELIAM